ncbi:Peptidase_C1 domain-containing protein/Inhibitor_I29 domain-containing protein [Cephalotus follicularis]|uniref:Peptidase_C1 domain-containing protein/Inhibitor_I29 domain-containing protein n=1 Tax=Cephalotus follicularis TaxID=3775 RepID=A0A1Q3BIX5_CEPFO|nr:Peptidase_C1 domain-containing protein/Inhibitor_I29 domain-containing protein [Cephalotus follicularis]
MGSKKNQLALLFFALASVTCLCFGLPSEYSIIGRDLDQFVTEERVLELFQQWKEKHSKVYKHAEEAEKRLENFKRNLKYVIEKNADKKQSHGFRVGLNKFADMSNEEFKKTHLSKVKKPITKKRNPFGSTRRKVVSCDAPSSLDWRKYGIVTAVKDQGECGSCWAFSTTGAIEGIDALVTGDLVSLSEQELVDCDTTNDGCDGGYMDYAFEWIIRNGGIDTESDYPYTSSDGLDGTCDVTKEETKVVTIDGYEDVDESDSALYCATAKQPISVGMDGSAVDFQLYTSGIYDGDCSDDPNDIDHAVLIVGYGSEDGEDYWIVKNSWGTSWGMNGYFYLRRNTSDPYGVCAVNAMASYPTKESSVQEDPSPSLLMFCIQYVYHTYCKGMSYIFVSLRKLRKLTL